MYRVKYIKLRTSATDYMGRTDLKNLSYLRLRRDAKSRLVHFIQFIYIIIILSIIVHDVLLYQNRIG